MGQANAEDWWRTAVIYQVYPRSFADSNGDGVGDLGGIIQHLGAISDLGVDAIWLSPFFVSPGRDGGYDIADYMDVDPVFGDVRAFDRLLAKAHQLDLKVLLDLVPNHSSSDHAWFQAALRSRPGSRERARYLFRDGGGEHGERPPNNWQSEFGGSSWTRTTDADGQPGQWYLHLFDASQPDFDWTNRDVVNHFHDVLRFWLDRGVDGFRVDVAHGLAKETGLPDVPATRESPNADADYRPYWAQDDVHAIFRDWRDVLAEYGPDRILVGEAWVRPLERLALWVRSDELHQTFNFSFLETTWNASALREVITESLDAFAVVGAPSTWVLSNHDVIRHSTRLALPSHPRHGEGLGPGSPVHPDQHIGLSRARAATMLMLALPGSAHLYQGEELGLPEVIDLPDSARRDPTFARTAGRIYGRDGARVPLPWTPGGPSNGFGSSAHTWLPQPPAWSTYAWSTQSGVESSTLEMYRTALRLRRQFALGTSELQWLESKENALVFRVGEVTVVANTGTVPVELPSGEILLTSGSARNRLLPGDTTAWIRCSS